MKYAEVHVKIGQEAYKTEVQIGKHSLIVDEPEDLKGKDLGPTPYQLLLSSLGTCKAITMRMYADLKEWPLKQIEVFLSANIEKEGTGQTTNIQVQIKLIGDLDESQRERILKIADRCPIHKLMSNPILIQSSLLS